MVRQSLAAQAASAASQAAPTVGPWQLRLFGAVSLHRGEIELLRWPSRAAILLVARLAMASEEAHPREALIELLWPSVETGAGRNRLRQVLSTLRALLEPGQTPAVLDADRQYIRLIPGRLQSDVERFRQALHSGDAAAARAIYRGEFLPGFYEEWVIEARRWLAEAFERIEQGARPGRGGDAPRPALARATGLPARWTRSFGLGSRLKALLDELRSERLTTIIGAGGSGKTRLAIEAAHALAAPAAAGGVREFERIAFVPLADCRDETDVGLALTQALGLAGKAPLDEACLLLRTGYHLLVLDNAEHIVASLRHIVTTLLECAPGLHLLLTSRRRLHLPGERLFALEGLALPPPQAQGAALRDNPAVALFLDRGRTVRPDFDVQEDDLAAVAELARELEGIPLAIELAASRMGSMSPAELLARLQPQTDDSPGAGRAMLELLCRDGDAQPRHASMSAVLHWSWDLLDAAEQRLLAAVCVTARSTDPERLAEVLGEPPLRVLRRVDELVGHSMLRRPGGALQGRCTLPQVLREFVRERWPVLELQGLRTAWLRALGAWAATLGAQATGARLKPELPTIHLLLTTPELSVEARIAALDLVLALRPHWESAGMPLRLQHAVESILAEGTEPFGPGRASAALGLLAYVRFEAGHVTEATTHAEAALRLAGGDPRLRAQALVRRSWITLARHRTQDDAPLTAARRALQEALALARAAGDRELEARALHQRGIVALQFDMDWTAAEATFARAQALWEALEDRRKAMARLRDRARCWRGMGRTDDAQASFERTLNVARDDEDVVGCIDSLLSLSTLRAERREWAAALEIDAECVALAWQHWHLHGLAFALWNPARSLAHLRQPETAMRLMAFAASFWELTFGPLTASDRRAVRLVQALARRQLDPRRAAKCWDEGKALSLAQAVSTVEQASAEALRSRA